MDRKVSVRATTEAAGRSVREVLVAIRGVDSASLEPDGSYLIRFDPSAVSDEELEAALTGEGFDVEGWHELAG